MTAMYHWLFVPLTLGLGFICAIMHTIYYRQGFDPEWKRTTRFWMRIFGINFAIGVATGIILEFEFGTNWSNYSYFVGDIFGAPLAIEGILAFFLEATFIAVMFFGWGRVSKGFHLLSTWMTAIGANISALWILVANNWMQFPVGMRFNVDTARNEMVDFWGIINPMAINKFFHAILSGFVLAGVVVVGISAWFLLKKRDVVFAKRSMWIGSIFGLASSVLLAVSGDTSAVHVAKVQPMKLAAMEGLYEGKTHAALTTVGILNPKKTVDNDEKVFLFHHRFDGLLSWMAYRNSSAYVAGISDLVYGNPERNLLPVEEKMERGKTAINTLRQYSEARQRNDRQEAARIKELFDETTPAGKAFKDEYFNYFGYGFLEKPQEVVPSVPLVFYSFRIMVGLGFWFILLFLLVMLFLRKERIGRQKWLLWLAILSIPCAYIAGQAGWIVTEVGRQPWTIQDMLPIKASVSKLSVISVQVTFFLFLTLFTVLLIAELMIIVRQIKIGPPKIEPDDTKHSY